MFCFEGDVGSKSVFGRGGLLDSADLSLGSYGLGSSDLGTKSSSSAKVQAYSSNYRYTSTGLIFLSSFKERWLIVLKTEMCNIKCSSFYK